MFELEPHRFGLGALDQVAGEAFLDLGEPIAEERAPVLEPGRPHLDVGANGADGRRALFEAAAGTGHCATTVEELGFFGFEGGQLTFEFGDTSGVAVDPLGEVGQARPERFGLGADALAVALDATDALE